ncbi:MAG: acyltransferase [Bacteroidaceae bacterium]|nr:acyltransferase [Bacteroidaceae bacterium]
MEFFKCWNLFYLKIQGVKYGKKLKIYNKIYVKGMGEIKIGEDFVFTSGDCINPICRNMRGVFYTMVKDARIEIGDRVGISSACLWAKDEILIGNDVNIGGDCLILDNDAHPHAFQERRRIWRQDLEWEEYCKQIPSAPIKIGNDVWIGARCQILKGVHIGDRSIIAAGSIVTKNVPSDVVAGGNPCKIIKQL